MDIFEYITFSHKGHFTPFQSVGDFSEYKMFPEIFYDFHGSNRLYLKKVYHYLESNVPLEDLGNLNCQK